MNLEYPDIFQKDNDWEFISSFYEDDPRPISSIDEVKLLKDKTLESLLVSRYYQCVALENFYEELIVSSDKILSIVGTKNSK
jgi:hypothetical protein